VTASGGPMGFQVYAADPVAQQVACLVVMKENKKQPRIAPISRGKGNF